MSLPRLDQPFVVGAIKTPVGDVPQVSSSLVLADRIGNYRVRWNLGRMGYTVDPGLYALGNPGETAPVLVTANYKLSFDKLREALPDRDAWVLALDTKGINVWCAAGKGTFGTTELVQRIESSDLARIVTHRQVILPQLGGPGVAAHLVRKLSGFKVIYGPVRAVDLPAFLEADLKATPEMRLKTFTTMERLVLIPVELVSALKWAVITVVILSIFSGLLGPAGFWSNLTGYGLFAGLAILAAVAAGAVLTPLLLPWLPGRAFSVKGLVLGLLVSVILVAARWGQLVAWKGRLELGAWFLLIPALAAYLAMNFTGASTYTSLSGVRREMHWAVPMEIGAGVAGLGLWFAALMIA